MTKSRGAFGLCLLLLIAQCAVLLNRDAKAQGTTSILATRSPWDTTPPSLAGGSYDCPSIVHVASDLSLDGFYSDPSYSIIDPQKLRIYEEASRPASQLVGAVAAAADDFLRSGSRKAAECALAQLSVASHDRALAGVMHSKQAYYVQGWTAGALALDYLKIRPALDPRDPRTRDVQAWFKTIAEQTLDYYAMQAQQGGTDARNNHIYWAALEIAAIGIADGNQSLWQWSMAAFQTAASDIGPDGTLSLEMARKVRALHYHLFAAAPLVTLAELGCANDIDLYHAHGAALRKLANRSLEGLLDNSYFAEKAGIAQDTPHGGPTAEEVGWAFPYLERFPDHRFAALVSNVSSLSYEFTGGLPPAATGCGISSGAGATKRPRSSN